MTNVTSQIFSQGNETVQLSFQQASQVTTNPWFFLPIVGFFVLTLIILLIWATFTKNPHNVRVINTKNFLPLLLLILFLLAVGVMLIIFPVYLKFF